MAAPGVLGNDFDVDGDDLIAILVSDVATGTLTLSSDGAFDYMPPLNWFGVVTFTYVADDDLVASEYGRCHHYRHQCQQTTCSRG